MIRNSLTGKQKSFLRSMGMNEEPVVQVGKEGVTPTVVQAAREAIKKRELIKVRVLQNSPEEPKDEFVEDPSLGPIVDMTMSRDDDEEELPEIHGANEKDDDLFASREGSQGNFFG